MGGLPELKEIHLKPPEPPLEVDVHLDREAALEMRMHGSLLILGLAGPELTAVEVALIRELQPVGFILGSRNLLAPEQTRRFTDTLRELSQRQPLVAITQEGGRAAPTAGIAPVVPAAFALAAHADAKATGTAGLLTGEMLRMLGVNFDFAPSLDLDPQSLLLGGRPGPGWGCDPQRVIDHAGQWNRWLRKRGIATCAKHFPAGGRAAADAPHELPKVAATLAELTRRDLVPYTALMPELDAILVGHGVFSALDPELPASLSPRLIRGLLRNQLGFDHGLVVPDDLESQAITRRYGVAAAARLALEAGNDLVLVGSDPSAAREAAAAMASLPHLILAEAWERVERLRDKLHWPLPWSDAKWATTCGHLAVLAAEVPEVLNLNPRPRRRSNP
jgi:beta-N-acetylhexosaminidase